MNIHPRLLYDNKAKQYKKEMATSKDIRQANQAFRDGQKDIRQASQAFRDGQRFRDELSAAGAVHEFTHAGFRFNKGKLFNAERARNQLLEHAKKYQKANSLVGDQVGRESCNIGCSPTCEST